MTDKETRSLATQIVKDNNNARVKIGRTNGEPVLHVRDIAVKDRSRSAYTVRSAGEWATCPLNARMRRVDREAEAQPIENMMAANGTSATR